ncbi:unnamed protein product [Macrosiphum euphorbiae]|uniref:MULE transposase domain-containing protein n=1 Tax=Macrosiphum euphorbiae TaxID=13131 RepID=A0AAV0XWN5_9HEMI|nr:unnamed protein product [Macrosiphum euphorbiae]CAI6372556.1 unnamed protein product [Macrosiphum euphorbiae]
MYDEEAIRNPNMAYTYLWTSTESSMRKARREHVPVLHETLNSLKEILEEQENLIQCNGHRFFQECIIVDGNGKAHVMFACPEVINDVILNDGTVWQADATFKVVPSMPKCRQLFMMHIIIQNHSVPICYVVMETFSYNDFQRNWIENAFSIVYPDAILVSCWFHYVQSLWKNIRRLHYTTYIRDNELAKKCLKMVMALSLLPAEQIELGNLSNNLS